jgi:hypothetical protein
VLGGRTRKKKARPAQLPKTDLLCPWGAHERALPRQEGGLPCKDLMLI